MEEPLEPGESYRIVGNKGYFDKVMTFVKIDSLRLLHFEDEEGCPYTVSSSSVELNHVIVKRT